MLKTLEFHNYRCFSDHVLPLKRETIIVGRNNAGKSTVIEGFRLIDIITGRYRNVSFRDVPSWLALPRGSRGVQVNLSGLNLSWGTLFHRYQPPPALVTAIFENDSKIEIHLGPDRAMYGVLYYSGGYPARTKGEAASLSLPRISVLPQVMPLNPEEVVLNSAYVTANMSAHLSPLHFRNQLRLFYDEYFQEFKTLVEASWPELQIIELQGRDGLQGDPLGLLVRDGDFVAEVAWMGHGLQMWLQTMWFLTRTAGTATVVLDEPDVYMHPDLQRRLLRFIRGRYPQCVIATHSTEILAEADVSNVLIVDRQQPRSRFTSSLPAVQRVLEYVGSAQNLQFTRLWNARKLLLVEGKDLKILRRFQDLLFPGSHQPFDALPNMSIGGWSGWTLALGSAMLLRNAVGEEIMTYCVLDSDYHTEEQKQTRRKDAADKSVHLHIWSAKEIENYLVVPEAIARHISKRNNSSPDGIVGEIQETINEIVESLKDPTTDAIAQEIINDDHNIGVAKANREARARIDQAWSTLATKVLIVSGKDLMSRLSQWSQDKYRASFGVMSIARELRGNELHPEAIEVVRAIEKSVPISSRDHGFT